MNKLFFVLLFILLSIPKMESQTILQGHISDDKEPLVGASVKITQKELFIRGAITDVDGNYRIQIDSGMYEVEFLYTGFKPQKMEKVEVLANKVNLLNVVFVVDSTYFEGRGCGFYWPPLISKDGTESGQIFTAEQMRHMY